VYLVNCHRNSLTVEDWNGHKVVKYIHADRLGSTNFISLNTLGAHGGLGFDAFGQPKGKTIARWVGNPPGK